MLHAMPVTSLCCCSHYRSHAVLLLRMTGVAYTFLYRFATRMPIKREDKAARIVGMFIVCIDATNDVI